MTEQPQYDARGLFTTSIRLPHDLLDVLRIIAQSEQRSVNTTIIRLLNKALSDQNGTD